MAGGVRGLFYGGGMGQLTAEIVGAVVCIAFTFTTFHAFFKIVGYLIGNRVSAAVELEGLDMAEVGVLAYPEFLPAPASTQPETVPDVTSVPILGEGFAVAEANAGDIERGQSLVVWAIADGRQAAASVHTYLTAECSSTLKHAATSNRG